MTIDCTGDGDIAARAGAEFAMGREADGACQPMTMIFTVAPFHADRHYAQMKDSDLAAARYLKAIAQARAGGELVLNPNDIFCAATYVPLPQGGIWDKPERGGLAASVNFTRVQKADATSADELTGAEILGRKQVFEAIGFMRRAMAGFKDCELISMPAHIGIRESRRILGDYVLSGDDVQSARPFDDVIARGFYTLDIHNPTEVGKPSVLKQLSRPYDIPYRTLVPRSIEGLLVAGRCISGDAVAMSSYRIQSHCMAMGQAAGTAAALAVKAGCRPRGLDITSLQKQLAQDGANLGPRWRQDR